MPRRRVNQWGVTFGTVVSVYGYEWSQPYGGHEILTPVNSIPMSHRQEKGIRVAQRAHRAFIVLAEKITADERVPSIDECRALVVEYANKYGVLWGSSGETIEEWRDTAAVFLSLNDVALATVDHSLLDDFANRLVHDTDWKRLKYRGRLRPRGTPVMLTIVAEGESLGVDNMPAQDLYTEMLNSSPLAQANFLLAKQINLKLQDGLSFSVGLLYPKNFIVAPRRLIDMLYLRIWMEAKDRTPPVRMCLNPDCDEVIRPKRGRPANFCSNACKQRNYRRRAKVTVK